MSASILRLFLLIVCLVLLSNNAYALLLYGVTRDTDELVTIDKNTGLATTVGSIGFSNIFALTFDSSTNELLGIDSGIMQGTTDRLISIDRATGAGTVIATLNSSRIEGLAYDASRNTLFGLDPTDIVVTIDRITGNVTQFGDPLTFLSTTGLAYDSMNDLLFGVDGNSTNQLFSVDPTTGVEVDIGETGFFSENALAYDVSTDTLFGIEGSSQFSFGELITLNRSTGVGTSVGNIGVNNTSINIDGLAAAPAIPIPPAILLFGSSILGFFVSYRKKSLSN